MKVIYSEHIPLRIITLQQLKEGTNNASHSLLEDIYTASDKVVSLLRDYERMKASGGHIYSFSIMPETLEMDTTGSGTIELTFPIQIFNGCRDINETLDDKMKLHLSVDFNNGTALITGEEAYTRDMDEI